MAKRVVGLNIQSGWIDVAEIVVGLRGIQVTKTGRIAFSNGQDQGLTDGIRAALRSANVKPRQTVMSIPSQELLLRFFTLPLIPKPEWESAIQFEARKYLPFKVEDLVWDFYPLESKETRQLSVVFVAARKEALQRFLRCAKQANVHVQAVESSSFGLARLTRLDRRIGPEEIVAIADVNNDAAHIVVVKGHLPYFARDISISPRLEPPPSEMLLQAPLAQPESRPSLGDARLEALLSELRLSFDFFAREFPDARVERVQLCGEEPLLGQWSQALATQLKLPVELATLPDHPSKQPTSAAFAVSLGLALWSLKKIPGPKPNLLRRAFGQVVQQRKVARVAQKARLAKTLAVNAGLAVVALMLVGLWGGQKLLEVRSQITRELKARSATLSSFEGKDSKALQVAVQELDERIGLLRAVVRDRVPLTPKLEALARDIPDGIWLQRLTYRDQFERGGQTRRTLELTGGCFLPKPGGELETISDFAQQMKQDGNFFQGFHVMDLGSVTLALTREEQHSYRTFELTCSSERHL